MVNIARFISRTDLRRLVFTLSVGAVGGALFFALNMPLAWMVGAMVFTTVASMMGARLYVLPSLRALMVTVLGVLLGSAFTPDILEQATRWPITLAAMLLYILLATGMLYWYFRKLFGYDKVTAYFSATPGGLSEMTIVGGAFGGDDRTIALVHGSRILLVVLVIPFWFRFTQDGGAGVSFTGPSLLGSAPIDIGILVLGAVVGTLIGKFLRLPAYRLVGPMVATAATQIAGVTESVPPYEIVFVAQVVVGSAIGARFAGIALQRIFRTMAASAGATVLLLVCTVGFTLALVPLSGMGFAPLTLAFAPGGLAEMSLIAISLGIETAFVATHHVARVVMIVIGVPLVFRTKQRVTAGNRTDSGR
ncbi:MAG: AbrB family transcriptional regulator [Proteobacteria bacterium]|nr:MAG: AbrB family transcriptional regulator [Pseudomonadota bacterium]TDJ72143.1 MAG: AbrB family transcriptional regulator [Pseudomonadota bacterium]